MVRPRTLEVNQVSETNHAIDHSTRNLRQFGRIRCRAGSNPRSGGSVRAP